LRSLRSEPLVCALRIPQAHSAITPRRMGPVCRIGRDQGWGRYHFLLPFNGMGDGPAIRLRLRGRGELGGVSSTDSGYGPRLTRPPCRTASGGSAAHIRLPLTSLRGGAGSSMITYESSGRVRLNHRRQAANGEVIGLATEWEGVAKLTSAPGFATLTTPFPSAC
jgi:hypothetical protein